MSKHLTRGTLALVDITTVIAAAIATVPCMATFALGYWLGRTWEIDDEEAET